MSAVRALVLLLGGMVVSPLLAQPPEAPVRVAVASNFQPVAQALGKMFSRQTGHAVTFSNGSTGGLFAQITQGAPFDVLLSADAARPRELARRGLVIEGSRQTYALGRLVLWSAVHDGRIYVQGLPAAPTNDAPAQLLAPGWQALDSAWWADPASRCRDALTADADGRVAIANPALAPYGLAAQQVIERLGWRSALDGRLVQGANVAQAYHMIATGNASFGFVALSQLRDGRRPGVCRWLVPTALHAPIEQQLVVLRQAPPAARQFARFVRTDPARELIAAAGYALPDPVR